MVEPLPPYGPPPGQPGGQAAYGALQGPSTGPTETEPKAVVALVLAVLANTPLVPFVGAVAALVLARYAKRDIDRSGGAKTGRGLATAATVLAVIHLVFVALLFVGVLVLLALGVTLPSL